jgi:hypothetical protein
MWKNSSLPFPFPHLQERNTVELAVKVPKLGVLGPSFVKTGYEIKNMDEYGTHKNQKKKEMKK